jgi:hypothetical protein
MKKTLFTIYFLLISGMAWATATSPLNYTITAPPKTEDQQSMYQYMNSLYQRWNVMQVTTTDPNGSVSSDYGALVVYNNGSNYSLRMQTATPNGTAWVADTVDGRNIINVNNLSPSAGVIPSANLPAVSAQVGLGAWTTFSTGSNLQASTDGFVMAYGSNSGGQGVISGYTDSNSTPSTLRATNRSYTAGESASIMFTVRKNDWYRVDVSGMTSKTAYFISIGN